MLQEMYRKMEEEIENLTQRVAEQAGQRCGARLLMTHPGVGPVTALATEVFLGDARRFVDGKALASYVGLIPREYSSGARQRLGGVTKQGSPLLRFLWCEAGAHAVRRDPELKRFYRRKLVQKGLGKARVAVARKLGIRLWIMLRDEIDYQEFCRRGQKQQSGAACAGKPEVAYGAKSPADWMSANHSASEWERPVTGSEHLQSAWPWRADRRLVPVRQAGTMKRCSPQHSERRRLHPRQKRILSLTGQGNWKRYQSAP